LKHILNSIAACSPFWPFALIDCNKNYILEWRTQLCIFVTYKEYMLKIGVDQVLKTWGCSQTFDGLLIMIPKYIGKRKQVVGHCV
jgi:hypothetical protein